VIVVVVLILHPVVPMPQQFQLPPQLLAKMSLIGLSLMNVATNWDAKPLKQTQGTFVPRWNLLNLRPSLPLLHVVLVEVEIMCLLHLVKVFLLNLHQNRHFNQLRVKHLAFNQVCFQASNHLTFQARHFQSFQQLHTYQVHNHRNHLLQHLMVIIAVFIVNVKKSHCTQKNIYFRVFQQCLLFR